MKGSSQLTAAGGEPSSNEGPVQLKIVFKKHPGVCDQLLALSRMAGVLAQQKDCFKGMNTEEKALQIAMGLPKETDTSQEHHRFAPASLLVKLQITTWESSGGPPHRMDAKPHAAGHLLVRGQTWFSCSSEKVLNSKGQRSRRYP